MIKCCVPHCTLRYTEPDKLHCLPFTSGLIWKLWLKMCPFLQSFSSQELEFKRICKKHFIRGHIDYEKGILRKDAIPLLHLTPHRPNKEANSSTQLFEINPIQATEQVNCCKIVPITSLSGQTENTFKCPSVENTKDKQQMKYLVCLKAEDTHGMLVDHNMYCLPSQADERPACLSSPFVSIEAGQEPGAAVDHNMFCGSPLPDNSVEYSCAERNQHNANTLSHTKVETETFKRKKRLNEPRVKKGRKNTKVKCNMKTKSISDAQPWRFIVEEAKGGATSRGAVSVASQTVADTQLPSHLSEQSPDFMSTNTKHSLNEELQTVPVELLDSQSVTLDNSDFNDNEMQDTVYVLPENIIVDKSTDSDRHKQSAVYVSPNVLNQLTSKSPFEKETLKSINIMFSTLKDQYNVPSNHIPTEVFHVNKFTPVNPSGSINNTKINIQPSVMKPTANVVQPAQKQTLETLVAELIESISAEETSEVQASPVVTAADTPARLLNPMSATAPRPLMQSLPVITQYPLTSNITDKKICYTKENSSEKEQMLRRELKKVKRQLIKANNRNKVLKLRFNKLQETAKPYLKRYKRLHPEAKALIDTQLRLAGSKPKAARYTEEEKLFALKLHQISPDCYRFLQQYLKLPNKKTMKCMPEFVKIA